MQKSETIKELAAALTKLQSSMGAITKDAVNPFFKSKYASLSAIIEDTRKPLAEVGLSYAQFPSGEHGLETILLHTSGEWISDSFVMRPVDGKPQSVGSALTYARRYALCAILGLQVEDDDGNEASKPTENAIQAKPVAPKAVAASRDAKKQRIKVLCDELSDGSLKTADEYKEFVHMETGFALVEANYDGILDALGAISNEQ